MSSFTLLLLVCASLIGCCLAGSSFTIYTNAGCSGSGVTGSGSAITQGSGSLICNSVSGISGVSSFVIIYATSSSAQVSFFSDGACSFPSTTVLTYIGVPDGKTCINNPQSTYRSGIISSNSGFNIYSTSLPLMILLAILSILSISMM